MTSAFHEDRKHECPVPLQRPVSEFDIGGMFFSPAGRWETITDRKPHDPHAARVTLHTDAAGVEYVWTLWSATRSPYLPSWHVQPSRVAVFELGSSICAEVTTAAGRFADGHTLVSAHPVRGAGWQVTDQTGGSDVEHVTVPSKARARAEVNRRARAHAKRLRLPLLTANRP